MFQLWILDRLWYVLVAFEYIFGSINHLYSMEKKEDHIPK